MARHKGSRKWIWLAVVSIAVGLIVWFAWCNLLREEPQSVPDQLADDSIEEYFKYGSIGAEAGQGIPYWIWLVLPDMFPEYLPAPGGWASIGFAWEPGRNMPIGFSRKTIGIERVGINCALCHATSVRREGDAAPRIYLGGPGNTVDPLAYQRFLFAAAGDPRFTSANVMRAIAGVTDLPAGEALIYRTVLIPFTRRALLEQKEEFAWTDVRPIWGRGRIDPFNPPKAGILGVGVGDTLGNSDMEAIWNLRPRVDGGMAFHWDGLNTDVREVVLSSALGDGATPKSLPLEPLARLEEWLLDLEPPRFAELFPIDAELAAAGAPVYEQHCASCHAFGGEQTGRVLPLTAEAWDGDRFGPELGPPFTDPNRAESWTPEAADAYNAYTEGEPWELSHFRSTGGYVNVPLDAIWIRAPYLHNGSVPYLGELLEPPAERTRVFHRGYDVYDPERIGFVSEGPEAERWGTRIDTAERGNSNQGHLWGTDLAPEEKAALLEYLKTL